MSVCFTAEMSAASSSETRNISSRRSRSSGFAKVVALNAWPNKSPEFLSDQIGGAYPGFETMGSESNAKCRGTGCANTTGPPCPVTTIAIGTCGAGAR